MNIRTLLTVKTRNYYYYYYYFSSKLWRTNRMINDAHDGENSTCHAFFSFLFRASLLLLLLFFFSAEFVAREIRTA